MNKKGGTILQTILNAGMIYAGIVLVIFLITGSSGGFKVLSKVGDYATTLPAWFWLVIGLIILMSMLRRK